MKNIFNNLVVYEMANNHMGDISHGKKIVNYYKKISSKYKSKFTFAFKLQYRNLDTFIHPEMKKRQDVHYIKRFTDTKLSKKNINDLVNYIRKSGFKVMSTPFDESSVDMIIKQKLDILKVASCSFNDWPLLEKISKANMPIIISTAGAIESELDKVVAFFSHRNKQFALMHCVAEYPTKDKDLNLNRINLLGKKYNYIPIGYSSHEDPSNYKNVMMAYVMGARIFEKHVGLPNETYKNNLYSMNGEQTSLWLKSLDYARKVYGVSNSISPKNKRESDSLRKLQRGVFLKRKVKAGALIEKKDVFFAFPPKKNQLTANQFSRYLEIISKKTIHKNEDINLRNSKIIDVRKEVYKIVQKIKILIEKFKINLPKKLSLEISHHYGLKYFYKYGLTMITVINRDYCKKILILLPNQSHPKQFHKAKEETFLIMHGSINLTLDKKNIKMYEGDKITIKPNQVHSFKANKNGCIIEELSTTHKKQDSFYLDLKIQKNKNRKTIVNHWL